MESDTENKSNSSVKSSRDANADLLSENGESHSETDSEKCVPMNLVTKGSLKKEVMDVDSDSLSDESLPKSKPVEVQSKAKPAKQKERKNRNPRPTKSLVEKQLKRASEESTASKDLDEDSPILSPVKTEAEDRSPCQEEAMDTDSETVIAPDSVSALKCEDISSSIDDKDESMAPDLSNRENDSLDHHPDSLALHVDIKKEVKVEMDEEEILGTDNSDDFERKPSQNQQTFICEKSPKIEVKQEINDTDVKKENGSKEYSSNDGSQDRCILGDIDDSHERSSQKEKSSNIDAIAKKLGRQVKENSEGFKENEDVYDDSSSNTSERKESSNVEKHIKKENDKKESKHEKKKKKRSCEECGVVSRSKGLKFQVLYQSKIRYLCTDGCFDSFKTKQANTKSPSPKIVEPVLCAQCKKPMKEGKGYYSMVGETKPLCSEDCLINYQEYNVPKKRCSQCRTSIEDDASCLTWETMEFCNEECLGKYQSYLGSHCTCCQSPVQQTSLGKYCVCFGADIRQFCSGSCLEEFKKGLKVCSFCQKDLSSGLEGFLAPVGDKGQFKDFCTQQCMERYESMNTKNPNSTLVQNCSFCSKSGIFKIQAKHGDKTAILCSETCVAGYRYANNITLKICDTCYKFFEPEQKMEHQLQFEGVNKYYCSKACMTLFVLSHRKIVPCCWCKVKKYNFDMIEKLDSSHQMQTYCSLNCISLFRVSLNATSAKSIRCDNCSKSVPAQYHLTMSDGSIRNFCSYQCVVQFQNVFTNVPALTNSGSANRQGASTPTSTPKTTVSSAPASTPVISSVVSLATGNPRSPVSMGMAPKLVPHKLIASANRPPTALTLLTTKAQTGTQNALTQSNLGGMSAPTPQIIREVIVKPPAPKSLKNKAVNCKPVTASKSISCKPHPCHKAVQTEEGPVPTIVPIPVPIYVPTPVHMFSRPVPVPLPFPVPIPVPIVVPLTRDPPAQVVRQLKDMQDKIPSNPFEAELLTIAEMVAENGNKPNKGTNSETVNDTEKTNNKSAASDLEPDAHDTPLDVEAALPSGIATVQPSGPESEDEEDEDLNLREGKSHGKRPASRGRGRVKRARVDVISQEEAATFSAGPILEENSTHSSDPSDANMRLKYAFGVNAWKHWVLQKNAHLEQGSQCTRKFKLFKTDLLQLAPDELNYSLCLFVKEVRKPNGEQYAAASIYYLCLGIQQYLFGNGRIDNIFTDPYYERFTDCLNDILMHQNEIIPSEGFFISRIEEEVLWESKQLGAHSPHVLLNTLMFFNTKYFNLKSIDDHAHLSFSHITKHWRKTSNKSNPRNVILRYYPPPSKAACAASLPDWQRRRRDDNTMYEQNENLDNPLRCPVKLYEFYMSKCPESVKTRNDVFYLYPERSCVPDSPVWYSTQPLAREAITKMLQRIKNVREVYES